MLRAAEMAKAAMPKANIINMLQLPGGVGSKQVMLQVRVRGGQSQCAPAGGPRRCSSIGQAGRRDRRADGSPVRTSTTTTLVFSDFLNICSSSSAI